MDSELAGREVVDLYPENNKNSGFFSMGLIATEKVSGCIPENTLLGD